MPDEVTALLDEAVQLLGECEQEMYLHDGTFALCHRCDDVRKAYEQLILENDE